MKVLAVDSHSENDERSWLLVDDDGFQEGTELVDPKRDFAISFAGEAYETFQKLVDQLPGYGVTITTQDGEIVEGYLMGANRLAEDGGTVFVYPVEDWGKAPDPKTIDISDEAIRSVVVGRVEVA